MHKFLHISISFESKKRRLPHQRLSAFFLLPFTGIEILYFLPFKDNEATNEKEVNLIFCSQLKEFFQRLPMVIGHIFAKFRIINV